MKINQNITRFLDSFIGLPKPGYAVMLNGAWGCGKTFYINDWIESRFNTDSSTSNSDLKPIYVSLYGKKNVDQIITDIKRNVTPWLYSKGMEFTKKLLKGAAKVALKVDINKDGNSDGELSYDFDIISLLSNKSSKELVGDKVLIFDDFERCQIPIKELMGYINFFVEHCECKVIIICDEERIKEDSNRESDYKLYKEKTIGRTFTVVGDAETALKVFCGEVDIAYDKYKDAIMAVYRVASHNNLRILRRSLQDFKLAFDIVENEYKTEERLNDFYLVMLVQFIITYSELLNNNVVIKEYVDYMFWREDKEGKVKNFEAKYVNGLSNLDIPVLNQMLVKDIMTYYQTGIMPLDYANEFLIDKERTLTASAKIFRCLYSLENEVFDKLVQEVYCNIENHNYNRLDFLICDIMSLSYLQGLGLLEYNLKEVKKKCKTAINYFFSNNTFDNDLRLRATYCLSGFSNGIAVQGFWKDLREYFFAQIDKVTKNKRDKLQQFWDEIDSRDIKDYYGIWNDATPDKQTSYELRAQFEGVNAKDLCKRIVKLSNANLSELNVALKYLYGVGDTRNISWQNRYVTDIPTLEAMKKAIDKENLKRTKIAKKVATEFAKTLDLIIKELTEKTTL